MSLEPQRAAHAPVEPSAAGHAAAAAGLAMAVLQPAPAVIVRVLHYADHPPQRAAPEAAHMAVRGARINVAGRRQLGAAAGGTHSTGGGVSETDWGDAYDTQIQMRAVTSLN